MLQYVKEYVRANKAEGFTLQEVDVEDDWREAQIVHNLPSEAKDEFIRTYRAQMRE